MSNRQWRACSAQCRWSAPYSQLCIDAHTCVISINARLTLMLCTLAHKLTPQVTCTLCASRACSKAAAVASPTGPPPTMSTSSIALAPSGNRGRFTSLGVLQLQRSGGEVTLRVANRIAHRLGAVRANAHHVLGRCLCGTLAKMRQLKMICNHLSSFP